MLTSLRTLVLSFFGQRWVRFGMVGVAATLSYMALALAADHAGLPVLVGNTLAYVISFGVSYMGHRVFTFHATTSHRSTLPKFAATQAVGLGLNTLIIVVLMGSGLPYTLAMPVAVVAVPVVVYTISKLWVFRDPAAHVPAPLSPPPPGSSGEKP